MTSKKFAQLPRPQQHKKCYELLRCIHDGELKGEDTSRERGVYRDYSIAMQGEDLPNLGLEVICDRFHWHLQQTSLGIKEHRLLPRVTHCDRDEAEACLPIAIYLDKIRSAYNIGSIVRTTEALRVGTLYFSEGMAAPEHKQVHDAAMGTTEWVSCVQGTPLAELPRPIIALETSPDAVPVDDYLFPPTFTLVLGNEEYGCSAESLALADHIVKIPLFGRKNSLNVANAYAIIAALIRRQQGSAHG